MTNYNIDITRFVKKHGVEDTDNCGQIVVYTGLMYDDEGNIVPWKDEYTHE